MSYRPRWEILIELIKENSFKRIAEIGVAEGMSTLPIVSSCQLEQYFLVDPVVDPQLYHKLADTPTSFMEMGSVEAARFIEDCDLDLVFIDRDPHEYEDCSEDIRTWQRKVRAGGILCGHDYGDYFPGVIAAVDEAFPGGFELEVDAVAGGLSVWWVRI